MFEFDSLIKACLHLGLDPDKRGQNEIEANSLRLDTFSRPFDFTSINFPREELEQVIKIGEIINNLVSQKKLVRSYNLISVEGKKEYETDVKIKKIMPTLVLSLHCWLKLGQENCGDKRNFAVHNGFVYEVDPKFDESKEKINKSMEAMRVEYLRKMKNSLEIARRIYLD